MQIYKTSVGFRYASKRIEICLLAPSLEEARAKMIAMCVERFAEIQNIQLDVYYGGEWWDPEPEKINTVGDLVSYLEKTLDIDCIGKCSFEINERYPY